MSHNLDINQAKQLNYALIELSLPIVHLDILPCSNRILEIKLLN